MARIYMEYVWDINFMIPNRNVSFKPYSIIKFTKSCDYFNNFIPMYQMTVKVEDRYLDYFRMFDKELFARIKLYAFYGANANKKTDRNLVFEDTFAIYIDKNSIPGFSQLNRQESGQKIEEVDKNRYTAGTITERTPIRIKMNLLLRSDLLMKTYIHNYVLGSDDNPIDPITAAATCISLNPHVKKFIIDPPDNTTKYTDLIVEPGELKQALYNIQHRYGIYAKGLQVFYDMGTLYVLNKLNSEHSITKGMPQHIDVALCEKAKTTPKTDFSILKGDGLIGYIRDTSVIKSDTESISSLLNGDKIVYSNFGTVINSVFVKDNQTSILSPLADIDNPTPSRADIGTKTVVDYDMLNNTYNISSYMFEQNIGTPIFFVLGNVDITHFTPNMRINVKFDNSQSEQLYSGLYNIKNADFTFDVINQPNVRFRTYGHVALTLFNKTNGKDDGYTVEKPD